MGSHSTPVNKESFMSNEFERFFHSSVPARDKYLSRLFALFSEQVVRAWCACPNAPYEDLGRPTLCEPGLTRGHTLDFTLRRLDRDATYVAELKCELEYEGYRYLQLTSADQLRHHTSPAFSKLLRVASDPLALDVRRHGHPTSVDGAILVWGAVAPEGRDAVMKEYAFADVLSVEAMLADLHTWAPVGWTEFVTRHRDWTSELFGFLDGSRRLP
jgi:hypothetical protein